MISPRMLTAGDAHCLGPGPSGNTACRSPAAPEFAIKFLKRASRGWEQSPSGCEAGSGAALRWLGVWLPASSTKSLRDARRAAGHSSLPASAPSPREKPRSSKGFGERGRERRTPGCSLLRLQTSGMSSRFWSPARDLGLPGLAVIQLQGTAAGHQLPPRAQGLCRARRALRPSCTTFPPGVPPIPCCVSTLCLFWLSRGNPDARRLLYGFLGAGAGHNRTQPLQPEAWADFLSQT